MTLIGSGIQIIPDRARPKFVESFGTANKLRLLDALRRSKLDRVILLTGDVHLAHLYEQRCRSLSGHTRLLELTSSGLSHVQSDTHVPFAKSIAEFISMPWAISEVFMEQNFGELLVSKDGVQLFARNK